MAKGYKDIGYQVETIIKDIKKGLFSPIYLLMGEESYYLDIVTDVIIENALEESERDFNQTIVYGNDINGASLIAAARRYPMFAQRQLVVVKEAQMMKGIEELVHYASKPLESTVLVLLMRGSSLDKRKAVYKSILKIGTVLESLLIKDYEVPRWIDDFYRSKGLTISPDATELLAEHAGTDLKKIALETEKMLKNLPEGVTQVKAVDIEKNIGISRAFSVFELTKELSSKNSVKALRIATRIGASPKFFLPMVMSAIFNHFYRILKLEAFMMRKMPDAKEKAEILGVNPYFFREYDVAVSNYPLGKTMNIISLLKDYDYKSKGGEVGEASHGELLIELVIKILNI